MAKIVPRFQIQMAKKAYTYPLGPHIRKIRLFTLSKLQYFIDIG